MKHQRAGTVTDFLISDFSSQSNQESMYCHNIPREYNLATGQERERPLPRKCPLWAAHLSEGHGWTLTGTVVWEAGL